MEKQKVYNVFFNARSSMVYSWIPNLPESGSIAIRFYFFNNRLNWQIQSQVFLKSKLTEMAVRNNVGDVTRFTPAKLPLFSRRGHENIVIKKA